MKRPILNKQERFYLNYVPHCTYSACLRLFLARKRFIRDLIRKWNKQFKELKYLIINLKIRKRTFNEFKWILLVLLTGKVPKPKLFKGKTISKIKKIKPPNLKREFLPTTDWIDRLIQKKILK